MSTPPAKDSDSERVPEPVRVRVRRSANIPAFLLTGAVLGFFLGALVDLLGPPVPSYTAGSSLAYLVVVGALLGALLGAIVAIVVERRR